MTKQRTKRVQVASSDVAITSGVHAPSIVQAAPPKSAQNAALLGLALGITGQVLKSKNTYDEKAGVLAAEKGEVNAETLHQMEKSAAWVKGAERVIGRGKAIEDEAAMKQAYAEDFDKSGTQEDLRTWMNEWMAERYEGTEPGIAREVAPFLSRGADALLSEHGLLQTNQAAAELEVGLATSTSEWLSRDEITQEQWDARRGEYTSLLGKELGLQRMADDLSNYVIATRDETVLDNPMFEKMMTNPATRDELAKAYAAAKSARVQDFMDDTQVARGKLYAEAYLLADAGDVDALEAIIIKYGTVDEDGISLLAEGEVQTLYGKLFASTANGASRLSNLKAFDGGFMGTRGDPKEYDAAYQDYRADLAKRVESGEIPEEEVMPRVIERIAANGKLPSSIDQQLKNASPSNQGEFTAAFDIYDQFQRTYPGELARHLSEKDMRKYEHYAALSQSHDPQAALELMKGEHNPKLWDQWTRDEKNETLEELYSTVEDIPWSLTDLKENTRLRKLVEDRAKFYAGYGGSIEDALEFALADIETRFQYVGDELYPAKSPWGTQGNEAAQFRVDQMEEANDEPYTIVPVAGEPGFVWVKPTDRMLPGIGEKVRIEDITRGYDDHLIANREAKAAEENALLLRSYEAEAQNRLLGREFLYVDNPKLQEMYVQQRQDAWGAISEAKRNAVLREIEEEKRMEAAADRVRARQAFSNTPAFNTQ